MRTANPSGRKCVVERGDHGAAHRNLRSWPEAAGRAPRGPWERRGLAGNPGGVFVSASEFVRASRPPGSARLGVATWPHRPRAGHCCPEVEDRSWSPLDRLHVPVPFPGWAASRPTRSSCLRPLPAGQPDLAPASGAAVPVCPGNLRFRPRTPPRSPEGTGPVLPCNLGTAHS